MKKKILTSLVALATISTMGVGMVGCGKTPPPSTKYNVTFDADNNMDTDNIIKEINKTDLMDTSNWPTLPADSSTGFAGEWVKATWQGDNIKLIANYGDGTEQNPYLVSTADQFKKMVDISSTTSHFRLLNDIDVSTLQETLYSSSCSISLDGGKYDLEGNLIGRFTLQKLDTKAGLTNGDGETFIFATAVDATFKNLNITYNEKVVSLVENVLEGKTTFENITTFAEGAFVNAMVSPYVFRIKNTGEVVFKNCVNNADIVCGKDYIGLFVGNYAMGSDVKVTFDTCVNNGNITIAGTVGMLFGNSAHRPGLKEQGIENGKLIVINCKNTGIFASSESSHILCPGNAVNGNPDCYEASDYEYFDTTIEGKIENIENFNVLIDSNSYSVRVIGSDVELTADNNLAPGTYKFVYYQRFFLDQDRQQSFRMQLKFEINVTELTESITFENVYMSDAIDLQKYLDRDYSIPQNVEWIDIENTNYRYFVDEEHSLYVVDLKGEYVHTYNFDKMQIVILNTEGLIIGGIDVE